MRSRTALRVSRLLGHGRACPRRRGLGASCRRAIHGCSSSWSRPSRSLADGAATAAPTGSSRAVVGSACAVFDVEEVESRRVDRELERRRPGATPRARVEARGEERASRRRGAMRPRRPRHPSSIVGRDASHAEASVRVRAELLEDVDMRPRSAAGAAGARRRPRRPPAGCRARPARARGRRSGSSGTDVRRRSARRRPRHGLDEVHGRRSDERGDEEVRAARVELLRRVDLHERPSRMTATRWPSVIASVWSCVT